MEPSKIEWITGRSQYRQDKENRESRNILFVLGMMIVAGILFYVSMQDLYFKPRISQAPVEEPTTNLINMPLN